jgi:lysophospholipase L1-like esterase
LDELFNIGLEILERNPLPQNTHFIVGSASHLAKIGTTMYALEWQRMVRSFKQKWLHATVGPLSPVLREQTAPEVGRQLTEIKDWFDMIYAGNICYQSNAWNKVMSILSCPPDSGTDLTREDIYTVALPAGLTDPNLTPHKYHINSCHAATTLFGGGATDELICALLDQLHCTFGCSAHSGDYLSREPAELVGTDIPFTPKTVLLIGGSHCRRLTDDFRRLGYNVIDKSIPGWQPTEQSITQLHSTLTELGNLRGAIVVLDLVSNITYRFTQLDGQLLLPIKMGGTYHLLGEVTTVNKELLVGTLKKLKGTINLLPGPKICIAPLPRYLHTPCCADPDHCVGVGTTHHSDRLLTQVAKVRKIVREYLLGNHTNIYVPDLLSLMLPGNNTGEALAAALSNLSGYDGVHLTSEGYSLLADTIHDFVSAKISSVSYVSGSAAAGEKPCLYYWRGFASPVGAARPERKFAYHENRSAGGKMPRNRFFHGHRGGRSNPPGGRQWN